MGLLDDLSEADLILNRIVEESLLFLLESVFPTVRYYSNEILKDLIFVPHLVAKQMLLALVLESGRFAISQSYYKLYQGFLVHIVSSRARRLRQLTLDQQLATTQDDYIMLAEQMDALTGDQEWRMDPNCPLYDRDRIHTTINHYLHLMRRNDTFELLYVLRGNLGRNQFGLLHKGLFSRAQAGTKVLVETYHNVVCAALDFVCDAECHPRRPNHHHNRDNDDENDIPTEARLAFFNEVRHAYGRSSLLLSGGAALGYYHVGVVKALMENNLMPRVIGGSSAGSIVCAMIGTRTDEECIHDFFQFKGTHAPGHYGVFHLDFFRPLWLHDDTKSNRQQSSSTSSGKKIGLRNVYQNTAGAFHDSKRTWQFLLVPTALRQFGSTIFDLITGNRRPSDLLKNDTEHFKNVVKANCGNFTFQEAFDRTGRICNIIVSPKNQSDPPRLLNYLTAPHVLVWSAAVASASVPGIFEADCLMVKDPDGTERYESSTIISGRNAVGVQFSDGSFEQDLPMQQLSEMFNINHFIISQVNPQAVLFGSYNHRTSVWSNPVKGFVDSLLKFLKHQCRSWLLNVMKFLASGRFRPLYAQTRDNIGTQLLTQEYEGRDCDISLIPWLHHRSLQSAFLHMLYNPTPQDFFEWMAAAERETWKYIPRIKCHIAEEIALDQCVQRLRNRLILEARTKRRGLAQTNNMIGYGLPSFFVSPSLTKLDNSSRHNNNSSGRQTVMADPSPSAAEQLLHQPQKGKPSSDDTDRIYQVPLKNNDAVGTSAIPTATENNFDVMNSGWAGLGLRGNRSSGSLDRQVSHPSGFFIDDEENPQQPPEQIAGELPVDVVSPRATGSTISSNATLLESSNYYKHRPRSSGSANSLRGSSNNISGGSGVDKTATMANFYYRRASENNLTCPSGSFGIAPAL